MRYSLGLLGGAGLLAMLIAVPADVHGQQPAAQTEEQHDHEHQAGGNAQGSAMAQRPGMMNPDMMKMMGDMKTRDAKIEALVEKMNAAKGTEKTEVMADLLTALVEDRKAMHRSMMGMMNMMGPMGGRGPAENDKPKQ